MTIYIFSPAFHQNTVAQMWYEYSNLLLPNSSSNNFLSWRKTCGEVNSGVTVSIWQPLASEEIGKLLRNMYQTRERRRGHRHNLNCSLRSYHRSYPVGSAPGLLIKISPSLCSQSITEKTIFYSSLFNTLAPKTKHKFSFSFYFKNWGQKKTKKLQRKISVLFTAERSAQWRKEWSEYSELVQS